MELFRSDPNATVRELSERSGLAVCSVHYHLVKLDEAGLIKRNTERGNRTGRYTQHISADELTKIRKAGASKAAKNKKQKDISLEERIDRIVARAKREAGRPTFDNHFVINGGSLKAHRIG